VPSFERGDFKIIGADRTAILEWLRAHPTMLFSNGIATPWALMLHLASDALILGCRHVEQIIRQSWFIVAADADWFELPSGVSVPPEALFEQLVPFPQRGQNCHRAEILVAAFARDVISVKGVKVAVVQGTVAKTDDVIPYVQAQRWQRAVAFRGIVA